MMNLTKLGKVTKTWSKDGKHRMYVNDLCAVLGIDPRHVKNGEEGRIARELMAAKLWYDVIADEWVSQGIGQARKEQLVAEILKQTGAEEVESEPVGEHEIETEESTTEEIMITIDQVREMSNEAILKEMRKLAANQSVGTVKETEELAMYYIVMSQRSNKDPKPKIKSIGYGIFEKAEKEGWF